MRRRRAWWPLPAGISGFVLVACGGDGTTEPPPPPPPPPIVTGCRADATETPVPGSLTTVDLAPGELVTLNAPADVRAFRLPAADEARSYEVIVQSASRIPGLSTAGCVRVRAERASGNVVPPRPEPLAPPVGFTDRELRLRSSWFENERVLREREAEELARVGAEAIRQRARPFDPAGPLAGRATIELGDTLTFSLGVNEDLRVDCRSTTRIRGEVRYAGEHFTVVEDIEFGTQPASDRFTDEEFETIGRQLDDVVYPMDVAYFGEPADIDGNSTVIALITAEVNKLTPAGEESIVAGFFLARDLTSASSCPASNEGEIFYLVGPDPDEDYGAEISLNFANALARTTVAHEFVHLLNTQQRVTLGSGSIFSDREVAWLDEGMAHLAEELAGLRLGGLGTRENLDLEAITGSEESLTVYNHYHLLNHIRLGRFLRGGCPTPDPNGPASTLALGDTGGEDPGGLESLMFRGFAYGFMRWLGDQFGEAGGGGALPGSREEALFRELSSGGPTHARGTVNVERAVRVAGGSNLTWEELVPLYLASLVADDNLPAGAVPRAEWRTWNLRGLYGQLNASNLGDECPFTRTYPLFPSRVSLHAATNSAVEFEMKASTGRFLTFAGAGAHPPSIVQITDGAGANLPSQARPQVTIIRVR